VWVSWDATDAEAVYRNNREATSTALQRGATGQPSLSEVLAARDSPHNPYFSPSVDP
jgi:5,6,7,8-tetrahydromethanopterin hydro-lyase